MVASADKGNPARLNLSARDDFSNEKSVASLKKYPWPFHLRESIMKMTWIKEADETFLLFFKYLDGVSVDYGHKVTSAPVRSDALQIIEPIHGDRQSAKVTWLVMLEVSGISGVLPLSHIANSVCSVFQTLRRSQELFNRDVEVDTARLSAISATFDQDVSSTKYSDEETQLLQRGEEKFKQVRSEGTGTLAQAQDSQFDSNLTSAKFAKVLPGSTRAGGMALNSASGRFFESSFRFRENSATSVADFTFITPVFSPDVSLVVGASRNALNRTVVYLSEVIIDTSPELCAAWILCADSRARTRFFFEYLDGIKVESRATSKHCFVSQSIGSAANNHLKQSMNVSVLKKDERGDIIIRTEPTKTCLFTVKGSQKAQDDVCYTETRLQKLDLQDGVERTKVVVAAEHFFRKTESMISSGTLALHSVMHLSLLRKRCDQSFEIDKARRKQLFEKLSQGENEYSAEEDAMFLHLTAITDALGKSAKEIKLDSDSPFTSRSTFNFNGIRWDKALGKVRAPIEDLMAFFWDLDSRSRFLEKRNYATKVVEDISEHCRIERSEIKFPGRISNREFCNLCSVKMHGSSTERGAMKAVTLASAPVSHKSCAVSDGNVRSSITSFLKLRRVGENETEVLYLVSFADSVDLPRVLSGRVVSGKVWWALTYAQEYFLQHRMLEDLDAMDGTQFAYFFNKPLPKSKLKSDRKTEHERRVNECVAKFPAISEYVKKNTWFPALVTGMLSNWINYAKDDRVIRSKLENLSSSEAREMGECFAKALDMCISVPAGVSHWIVQYPALVELCKRDKFFESMAIEIGKRKLIEAPWGLIFRVAFGAFLSFSDIGTDVSSIVVFFDQGRYEFAYAMLGMIALCMSLQLLVIYLQHRKKGWKVLLKEAVPVFLCVKPISDAYHLASGLKVDELNMFDPRMEILLSKLAELFSEGLPASCLQTYGYLVSKDRSSPVPIISIIVSVLTIGYTVAMISYDKDVDPVVRAGNPVFYG